MELQNFALYYQKDIERTFLRDDDHDDWNKGPPDYIDVAAAQLVASIENCQGRFVVVSDASTLQKDTQSRSNAAFRILNHQEAIKQVTDDLVSTYENMKLARTQTSRGHFGQHFNQVSDSSSRSDLMSTNHAKKRNLKQDPGVFRSISMSLYDRVCAGVSNRYDFPIRPEKTALLIIDIQKYLVSTEPYLSKVASPRTIANISKLRSAFRKIRDRPNTTSGCYASSGCEVIFTYLQCLTNDGRDISLDYKLSGPELANIPRASCKPEDIFLSECYPGIPTAGSTGKGDILISKTSCSVFRSTNIDYVLRNLRIEQLVITGQITNQCIESAVRDAADSGYFVTVVKDACSAHSEEDHESGLLNMKGFCRILSTTEVLNELGITE